MTDDIIDVQAEEMGTDLVPHNTGPATLFRTDEPDEVVERATATANALARVVRDQNLASNISGREHVKVEGWTLLGSMLGVFAVCVDTHRVGTPQGQDEGWHARVEARTLAGAVVGAAEAECLRSEKNWKTRDDYALLSMAQTRATSKALRQPLGFVMTLAGFDPTPTEEMPAEAHTQAPAATEKDADKGDMDTITLNAELLQKAYPDAAGPGKTWRKVAHDYALTHLGVTKGRKYTKKQAVDTADWLEQKFRELSDPAPFEPEVPPEVQEEIEAIADETFKAPPLKEEA